MDIRTVTSNSEFIVISTALYMVQRSSVTDFSTSQKPLFSHFIFVKRHSSVFLNRHMYALLVHYALRIFFAILKSIEAQRRHSSILRRKCLMSSFIYLVNLTTD